MCQSTSFTELASFIPTEGAVYDYVTAGMGRFWGITATLAAYVIVTCFASQIYIPFFIMLAICAVYAFFWLKIQKVDLWKPVEPEEILES